MDLCGRASKATGLPDAEAQHMQLAVSPHQHSPLKANIGKQESCCYRLLRDFRA